MSKVSPLRQMIIDAGKSMNLQLDRVDTATKIKTATNAVLKHWGAVQPGKGQQGLESFNGANPERNTNFDPLAHAEPTVLMNELKNLKMSAQHIAQVTESCMQLFDGARDTRAIVTGVHEHQSAYVPLASAVGRTNAVALSNEEDQFAMEAFGQDTDRLATDERLSMDLIIMRPYDNPMDKALARVNESSPVVTIKTPEAEVWDWAKTQDPNSTLKSRNQSTRLRDLYRNPTPVNTKAKRIVPLTANDTNQDLFATAYNGVTFYKTNRNVAILDLGRDGTKFGYDRIDRTDIVADGAILDNVLVQLVKTGTGAATETFLLNTRSFEMAMFVTSPSSKSSAQRQVIMKAILPITSTTKQADGTASTIAALLTDAKLRVNLQINATLNIQTGELQASGTASIDALPLVAGGTISAGTQTNLGTVSAQLAGYSVEAYYNEENQRKANLAVWVRYYEQQFVVPRSRVVFTEYSLAQEADDNAVQATSSAMALGNGRRGLDTIVNALNDIAGGMAFAQQFPEVASVNSIDEQSFAASLVKPTVITGTLDFNTAEVNVMNESTRLSEMHGRFRAYIMSQLAMLFAKSLMLNQYKGGEKPVIKVFTHSTIADMIIGITDYHPDLKDEASTATGADFSMVLPNGYRLDIIKTNWDCLQGKLYAIPVIESDMGSVLSAASIRDCGTFTTNYTPTNAGSVVRRIATTTREIVMMSNKVGVMLNVLGITHMLGDPSFAQVPLNADTDNTFTY